MTGAGVFARLDTVILRVRDLKRSTQWYLDTLGLRPAYEDDATGIVVLGTGGPTSLTLWRLAPGEAPPAPGAAAAFPIFACDDADATRALLAARGARVTELQEAGGVRTFQVRDPDGNAIEACQVLAA